jgi:hypothetical protein
MPEVDARLAYWTAAWVNMALIAGLAGLGIASAHRRAYARHRRLMQACVALVGLFVLSYAGKLLFLGREPLAAWNAHFVIVLRVHEACVAVMVLCGATAIFQAHRLGLDADPPARTADPTRARGVLLHRRAGSLAFAATLAGLATAAYVLYGMYQR